MGNRAVITTEDKQIGVYVHWNGGRDSVEAFLLYCKIKGYRAPENDCYGWARLCQVIANYLGGTLSVGIDRYDKLDTDNGDNGTYIIKDWQIIGREFYDCNEEQNNYTLLDMVEEINSRQPEWERFDNETIEREINNITISPITTKQIKAIHAVVNELGFSDTRYRGILLSLFNIKTCKELTEQQASILIETLNKIKVEK